MTKHFLLLLLPCILLSSDYKITTIGTEHLQHGPNTTVYWEVHGINNSGVIFGKYSVLKSNKISVSILYLYDLDKIIKFIEHEANQYNPSNSFMNNNGQLIGSWNSNSLFVYDKEKGIRDFSLELSKNNVISSTQLSITDFNDAGQVIGTYSQSYCSYPYLWGNNIFQNMGIGSALSKSIEIYGYKALNIKLYSINNSGTIAGCFAYGKYNVKQDKYHLFGYKIFLWNKVNIKIIDIPSLSHEPLILKINNNNIILVKEIPQNFVPGGKSYCLNYLWSESDGITILENFNGEYINDNSEIFGYRYNSEIENYEPCIWKNGKISSLTSLLGVKSLSNLASKCSDDYAVESISNFKGFNNKGQIPCIGYIWGEPHPCILEPINQ